jgi:hypothetical protein
LTGQQGHGLATGIADDRMDKTLFDSAAAFQSDAMRFDYDIQSTTRAVAGNLQPMNRGWSSRRRKLRELIHALKSWLSDGGFQRRRACRTTSIPSIQGTPKLAATLGSSGAVRISIRPPAKVEPFVNRVAFISSKS